jgi:hypothetical protein
MGRRLTQRKHVLEEERPYELELISHRQMHRFDRSRSMRAFLLSFLVIQRDWGIWQRRSSRRWAECIVKHGRCDRVQESRLARKEFEVRQGYDERHDLTKSHLSQLSAEDNEENAQKTSQLQVELQDHALPTTRRLLQVLLHLFRKRSN